MAQYDEINEKKGKNVFELYNDFKSNIATFLGLIVAVIGVALVFFISSLEGTKEIKASNRENANLLSIWRETNTNSFPENKVDVVKYKGREYYFIIESYDSGGAISEWYFAFDGGLGYMFQDYKFYVLTGITIMVSIFVAKINYTTSKNSTMNGVKFLKTLIVYQEAKSKIAPITHLIPLFCSYKNKQLYEETKQEIVESVDIRYDHYMSKDFDFEELAQWQKDGLNKIKKIEIERITSSDLLREKNEVGTKKSLLPISPEEHQRQYMRKTYGQKVLTSVLSGMTFGLGIVLGNWVLGATYGFTVIVSFITANIAGSDYANSSLRQRYIAKADLLNELYNLKDYFIELDNKEKEEVAIVNNKEKEEVAIVNNKEKEEVAIVNNEEDKIKDFLKLDNFILLKERQEVIQVDKF